MHAVIGKNDAKIGIYVKMVLFSVIRKRVNGIINITLQSKEQPEHSRHTGIHRRNRYRQGLKKQQITLYVYENVNSIGSRAAVQLVRAGSA